MKSFGVIFYLIVISLLETACNFSNRENGTACQQFRKINDPEKYGFFTDRLSYIDTTIENLVNKGILPNGVTFVAHKGRIIHNKAYGWKNIEENISLRTDDIFRIASQTKAITSVALMTLFEEGKFLLDDPVSMYISEFKNPAVLNTFDERDTSFTTRPAIREITIRQLLTHTSGIHYGILHGGIGKMIFEKAGIPAVNSLEPFTIEEIVKKIASYPLMFDPGEQLLYGMNLDVCGYLIEVISGKPLDVFFYERIFEPLDMRDTYFYLPAEKADRLVRLYSSSPDGLVINTNPSYQTFPVNGAKMLLLGGAGLCSTIEDYAKFCQMMLNGGSFNGKRIISRSTVELMTMNQIGEKYFSPGMKSGLGFALFGEEGSADHLVSSQAYRAGGMFHTDAVVDPEENLILLFFSNIQPRRGPDTFRIFRNLVYQALK